MHQTLVTLATLIATGAHALFGCCWHHEHAHGHAVGQIEESAVAVVHHQCGCGHATTSEEQGESEGSDVAVCSPETDPCGHSGEHNSGECGGRCQFLTNAKAELPALGGPNLASGMFPQLFAVPQTASGLYWQWSSRSAALLSGSLCVRDLTQIARI